MKSEPNTFGRRIKQGRGGDVRVAIRGRGKDTRRVV